MAAADDDEPVPRIPRRIGFRASGPQLARIALTAAILLMVVLTQGPCAEHVSSFVTSFDDPGPTKPVVPPPGAVDGTTEHYEHIRPDMTEAEVKAAIEREKARARTNKHDPR